MEYGHCATGQALAMCLSCGAMIGDTDLHDAHHGRPTLPQCEDCGHPLASHHPTPKGKGAYCTIWVHRGDANGPMKQCECAAEVRGG